jgi:transcription elongation factor Elf1
MYGLLKERGEDWRMKQCVKRVYCPTCQKLVKCQEKTDGGKLQIVCSRCGNPVQSQESGKWRYIGAVEK